MSARGLFLLYLASAFCGTAQQIESEMKDDIRRAVERYMDAVRRGDSALASTVSTSSGRRVSAGGTAEFDLREHFRCGSIGRT